MGICKINPNSIGRRIDIRVVNFQSYYASLLYFTGNKYFNIYIRKESLKYNYSLNEYGMLDIRDNSIIFIKSEEEIFKKLKIEYLKPEERNKF
jgi:DNA polymerase/3'-5' exonuclease PolX